MRALLMPLLICLTLILALPTGARAQSADIEATIGAQLEAFKADAFDEAFTFASPTIKGLFRTPEIFGQMVRNGYPMVWRPGAVRYLDLRDEGGRLLQRVEITDARGARHLLEYEMIELEEGWKINGVRLLKAEGFSA
ncbi:hypothetical protein ATO3_11155 [Marinibacterium profundimaris]|uniref:DUF4864 domain-containing protein n=2 Tax=Marinibacterium profundimaris TaxID=1679460 RepID=A0A225NHN3_9RHOB|nr:DUF4864 domain-containing protein [Marinibacterium profundimaris]OWU73254.1 hypothetical protein ATO3_11155 [Marinibacterium profundimaris]